MKVIIDRFEGEFAVVEMDDRKKVNMPKILIPKAKEGDIIEIKVDSDETNKRREEINKLMNDVWNRCF